MQAWHLLVSDGLSPRVRGNPLGVVIVRRNFRSIPACAGEPPVCTTPAWAPEVYPRVCGGTA